MNLLDYFHKRLLAKACASYRSTSEYVCWNDARCILMIYDSDASEQNLGIRTAVEAIEAEGKKVSECIFVDKKKAVTSSISSRTVVDRKGIDFLGRPSTIALTQLIDNDEFDVIINLSRHDVMTYIVMAVRAKMKCGRQNDNHILDFQIEGDLDQQRLLDEVIRYLKMIKK